MLGLRLNQQQAAELSAALKVAAEKYAINTPLRVKHFLGQCLEETGGLVALSELGGYTYCENKYGYLTNTGKNLGNTLPDEGYKFRGRGLIQLTGKSNYSIASKSLYGDNRLLETPDLIITSLYNATLVSAWWWYNCNKGKKYPDGQPNFFADADDIVSVSKTVNGGPGSVNKKYTPYNMSKRIEWTNKMATVVKSLGTAASTNMPRSSWIFGIVAVSGFFF